MGSDLAITNWDRAYAQGKYNQEGPIPLVQDIIKAIKERGLEDKPGFYPGCGNGRNFIPLLDAELRLEGNDISPVAIEQLKALRPHANVSVGDLLTHDTNEPYWYILSIQLFQHGSSKTVGKLFDKTFKLLRSGGLFVLRVNSIHTQIIQKYDVVEQSPEEGFTVQYRTGQKKGQEIHFYSAEEIHSLTEQRYEVIMPMREEFIPRDDGTYWVQWETILKKR